MSRGKLRSVEADANLGWWDNRRELPAAILIAAYSEGLDILERTIIGAKSLRPASKEVLVLDDSRRDGLRVVEHPVRALGRKSCRKHEDRSKVTRKKP